MSTASTYDKAVLEAIASLGGGSVRRSGEDPARAAFDLLAEVAQPAVKDLKVTFEGLSTARVYPDRLPNLAAGTQQVVLGRFLPQGDGPQTGSVIVTGTRDGKPVRHRASCSSRRATRATPSSRACGPASTSARSWSRAAVRPSRRRSSPSARSSAS